VSSRLRFPQAAAADMRAAKYRERGRDKREERERQSRPGSKFCISSKYHCQLVVVLLTPG